MFALNDFFFTGHHDWGPEWWSAAAEGTGVTVHQLPQQNPSLFLPGVFRALFYTGLPFLVCLHSDPESGQTQGGHLCPIWAVKAFTKNKANSKQIKSSSSSRKCLSLASVFLFLQYWNRRQEMDKSTAWLSLDCNIPNNKGCKHLNSAIKRLSSLSQTTVLSDHLSTGRPWANC